MVEASHKSALDLAKTESLINNYFDKDALPALEEYIRIPNLSRAFDPDWATNGLFEKAADHLLKWATSQNVKGLKLEIIKEAGHSPVIFGEITATADKTGTLLFYGHFDKQPHMEGWREGLGPTKPVIENGRLYGRGASDDGYAIFATILAIKACQEQGLPHSRCVLLFECDEESGTGDLEHYCEKLMGRIGQPDIIFILDSGTLGYEQMWVTNSLRGYLVAKLKVDILTEGVHSGNASGVVPSTFRIARMILNRLENVETGEIHPAFHVNIPSERYKQAFDTSEVVKDGVIKMFPFVEGAKPVTADPFQVYLNRIWKPQLSITGADGLPATGIAGNVLRASTTLKLSLRLPPTLDPEQAKKTLVELLSKDAPYGAKVTVEAAAGSGWNAPPTQPWLDSILAHASLNFYKKPVMYCGEGGSIPFLGFLKEQFPKAQFVTTGVLGPNSNAHSVNEFLDIPFTKKLICCMAQVVADSHGHLKH